MNRTSHDQQGRIQSSPTYFTCVSAIRWSCQILRTLEKKGRICQSFAGVKKKCRGGGEQAVGCEREKWGKTSCQFWAQAEVQWRDTHPRGEDIFEVQLHQSALPLTLIFNLCLSPPVIAPCVYCSPSVNEEGDWHTYWRLCWPGASGKLHTWAPSSYVGPDSGTFLDTKPSGNQILCNFRVHWWVFVKL